MTIEIVIYIAKVLLMVSLILSFLRVFLGPTFADRVLALDLLSIQGIALISLLAINYKSSVYLDVGIAIVLAGFFSMVTFARYFWDYGHHDESFKKRKKGKKKS